ncbi:hypothetical protein OH492_09350 [Vibrio chagasii]|nr:hypothetical protein [Vibrio chagasii]
MNAGEVVGLIGHLVPENQRLFVVLTGSPEPTSSGNLFQYQSETLSAPTKTITPRDWDDLPRVRAD